MKTGPENTEILSTIEALKRASKGKTGKIWASIGRALLAPSRRRASVNLSKLDEVCKDGAVIVVPGKVLASGKLGKKLTVAAMSFSAGAFSGVKAAGGKCLTIKDLVASNPKGTGIMIVK
jgi:large subunit ribosomal protein L18e